jgi:hypothetical protein
MDDEAEVASTVTAALHDTCLVRRRTSSGVNAYPAGINEGPNENRVFIAFSVE